MHTGALPSALLSFSSTSIIDTDSVNCSLSLLDAGTLLPNLYSWTQTGGPSTLSLSPANQTLYEFDGSTLLRGNYSFSTSIAIADSNSYIASTTGNFVLNHNFTGAQIGHKFTFTTTAIFNLSAGFTCGTMISATYLPSLGTTPLCQHTNETSIIYIYASQDHTLSTDSELYLGEDYLTSAYTVEGELPALEISLLPNISGDAESTATITLGLTLTGFNSASMPINSVTWTKNEGPDLPSFNETDIAGQTWGPADLTLGDYNFTADIGLEHSWVLSHTLAFQVFVTLTSTTFVGQRLYFGFDGEFLPFSTCGEVINVDTLALMGSSPLCSSPQPTYLEIWFDQDAAYSVNAQDFAFLPAACLHGGPYPLAHDLPHLVIDYGGSYSIYEDRNLTGIATDITDVTPAPTFTFTQDAGGPETINLNSTESYQLFPKGSLLTGTYDFQLRMDFPSEFKSLYRIATASLVLTALIGEVTQGGNELNIMLTWGILIDANRVNEPVSCDKIIDTDSVTLLSPSLCRHNNNILTIFVSNISTVVATDTITLIAYPTYNASLSFPMPLDPPRLTLTGAATYDTESDIVVTGIPTSVQGVSPIYTWTQISGPQAFIFASDSLIQTFQHPSFRVGTYELALNMQIPNSNGYVKDASATVIILSKFKLGRQLGNQFEIVLTWPLELDGNMVNEPIDCDIILEAGNKTDISPIQCNHNYNTIGIITTNSSVLAQSSLIHLRPLPGFSQQINYTIPNDLPKVTILGGGTYSTYAAITLTVIPSDITGFLPTYAWTQVSGPETLILNSSLISQTFDPDVFSTGEYVFEVVMSLPATTLGYTYKASSTIIIQSAFVKGEQYGPRFRIYLTYAIWLSGSKNNPSLDCADILDAATITLLQPSLCTHNDKLLTIYASNQSTGNVIILLSQSFFSESISYTGPNGMPALLPIVQSGSDPWESSDSGNTLTTSNNECTGLQVEYTWEVVNGNPLTQFTNYFESAIEFQPMSIPAGDYTIKCSMSVAGGNGYISTQTIDFSVNVRVFAQSQKGNIITIIMSGGFYLNNALEGNSTCSNILPSIFLAKIGSNPKCTHEGAMLRIFLSNNSVVAEGDSFDLQHTHFSTTLISDLKPVPTLELSIPTSMDGSNQLRTKVIEIKGELTSIEGTNYTLTWSQIGGSPPSTILFDNTELSQIIGEKLIKEGNYSVGIKVLFDNSNDFELNKVVNFTYASIPSAKIVGGMTGINYNLDLDLTTYMSVDNDIGAFSSELKWIWEGSADAAFSSPAIMYNGQEFNPDNYANQDLKFGSKELKSGLYYFKLKMSKWEHFVEETTTQVEVFEFGPTIKLTSSTTAAKHNPLIDLCVQAFVFSYDGLDIVNKWIVKPAPAEKVATQDSVCILAKYLIPGTTYTITCIATEIPNTSNSRRLSESYSRSMTTTITISKYPEAKDVQITPKVGHGLTDSFTFNLRNWFDTEGTQLKYMILAKVVGSTAGFVAVNSYTALETFTTMLPTGDPAYNYLVIVRIQGVNGFGATVHKDASVKVIEPANVDDPNTFLKEELFASFDDKPFSDQLYRMSCATFFAQLPIVPIDNSDPCGGCGEKGECLVEIKECKCFEDYQGIHCEHSPEAIQRVHEVTANILGSKFIYIIYIYLYIETNDILENGDLNILFAGEGGST